MLLLFKHFTTYYAVLGMLEHGYGIRRVAARAETNIITVFQGVRGWYDFFLRPDFAFNGL